MPKQSLSEAQAVAARRENKPLPMVPFATGNSKGTLGWYNGFSPSQRMRVLRAMNLSMASGVLSPAQGPCDLCSDPAAPVFYHSEDYSEPLRWEPPAAYCLCQLCHLRRVHMRFAWPLVWRVHLGHVRRGGYGSDLKSPEIRHQLVRYRRGLETGVVSELPSLRPYALTIGREWFAALSMDPRSRVLGIAIDQGVVDGGPVVTGDASSCNQLRRNAGALIVGMAAYRLMKPEV